MMLANEVYKRRGKKKYLNMQYLYHILHTKRKINVAKPSILCLDLNDTIYISV